MTRHPDPTYALCGSGWSAASNTAATKGPEMTTKRKKKDVARRRAQAKSQAAKKSAPRTTPGRSDVASGLSTQVPRPRVTAYNQLTVFPVFPDRGEAGPPEGSPGEYDVTFTLGVPG